jgi:hypothetical protein
MRSGSCPRQQTPLPEPSRSMWRAIFTLLPIALALILLPAIAFASPPDPSWIAGIYDGADGDDIVSLVYETSAAKMAAPSHFGPLPRLAEISFDGIVRSVPDSRLTRRPRSPPVLWSTEFASLFNFLPPPASRTGVPITKSPVPVWRLPNTLRVSDSSHPRRSLRGRLSGCRTRPPHSRDVSRMVSTW